jgi:hypothetical protein
MGSSGTSGRRSVGLPGDSAVSDALAVAVADALGASVVRTSPVSGGCISEAGRVDLADGRTVFAKLAAGLPGDLLPIEAEGLRWLGEVDGVPVPDVLAATADVLVLTWLPPGRAGPRTEAELGRALAHLHGSRAPSFGWHRDRSDTVTPRLLGLSITVLEQRFLRPMAAGDSSAAPILFERLNADRRDSVIELRFERETYTVTDTGIVRMDNPVVTYRSGSREPR